MTCLATAPRSGIYVIVNTLTGRQYVGSSRNIEERWTVHRAWLQRGSGVNEALRRDVRLYGAAAFRFAIIEETEPDDRLLAQAEFAWILRLQQSEGGLYNVRRNTSRKGLPVTSIAARPVPNLPGALPPPAPPADAEAGKMLTVRQAAERLQCHPETVKRMLRDGEIRGSQPLGRRGGWRVAESQILGLLTRAPGRPKELAPRPAAGLERERALAELREDTRRALERGDLVAAARYEAALAAYGDSPLE